MLLVAHTVRQEIGVAGRVTEEAEVRPVSPRPGMQHRWPASRACRRGEGGCAVVHTVERDGLAPLAEAEPVVDDVEGVLASALREAQRRALLARVAARVPKVRPGSARQERLGQRAHAVDRAIEVARVADLGVLVRALRQRNAHVALCRGGGERNGLGHP